MTLQEGAVTKEKNITLSELKGDKKLKDQEKQVPKKDQLDNNI